MEMAAAEMEMVAAEMEMVAVEMAEMEVVAAEIAEMEMPVVVMVVVVMVRRSNSTRGACLGPAEMELLCNQTCCAGGREMNRSKSSM